MWCLDFGFDRYSFAKVDTPPSYFRQEPPGSPCVRGPGAVLFFILCAVLACFAGTPPTKNEATTRDQVTTHCRFGWCLPRHVWCFLLLLLLTLKPPAEGIRSKLEQRWQRTDCFLPGLAQSDPSQNSVPVTPSFVKLQAHRAPMQPLPPPSRRIAIISGRAHAFVYNFLFSGIVFGRMLRQIVRVRTQNSGVFFWAHTLTPRCNFRTPVAGRPIFASWRDSVGVPHSIYGWVLFSTMLSKATLGKLYICLVVHYLYLVCCPDFDEYQRTIPNTPQCPRFMEYRNASLKKKKRRRKSDTQARRGRRGWRPGQH